MLNKIVDGISEKLNKVFGDDYKIYTESVKQGLKTPCFFIQLVTPVNVKMLGERFFRENLFCIQYFPATNEPKTECYKVQDDLFLALEHIEVDGDLQRGVKMRGEFVEGVLNFFVNYNMFVKRADETPTMEILQNPDIQMKG